jgi:hypothetical protein
MNSLGIWWKVRYLMGVFSRPAIGGLFSLKGRQQCPPSTTTMRSISTAVNDMIDATLEQTGTSGISHPGNQRTFTMRTSDSTPLAFGRKAISPGGLGIWTGKFFVLAEKFG